MELVYDLEGIGDVAKDVLQSAKDHDVWAFYGEMGAGKTTLIHALCVEMKVTGSFGSPTFSIINEYVTEDFRPLYHIDLYRCKNEEEAIRAGVEDCFYSGNTCMVEWPSKAESILPENTLHITITVIDERTRKLDIFNSFGDHSRSEQLNQL